MSAETALSGEEKLRLVRIGRPRSKFIIYTTICIAVMVSLAIIASCIISTIEFFIDDASGFITAFSIFRLFEFFGSPILASVKIYAGMLLVGAFFGAMMSMLDGRRLEKTDGTGLFFWAISAVAMGFVALVTNASDMPPVFLHSILSLFSFFTGCMWSFWIGAKIRLGNVFDKGG